MEILPERWWHLGAERRRWNSTKAALERINRAVLAEKAGKMAGVETTILVVPESAQVVVADSSEGTIVEINLQPQALAAN